MSTWTYHISVSDNLDGFSLNVNGTKTILIDLRKTDTL